MLNQPLTHSFVLNALTEGPVYHEVMELLRDDAIFRGRILAELIDDHRAGRVSLIRYQNARVIIRNCADGAPYLDTLPLMPQELVDELNDGGDGSQYGGPVLERGDQRP